jgi:hypothetical protein
MPAPPRGLLVQQTIFPSAWRLTVGARGRRMAAFHSRVLTGDIASGLEQLHAKRHSGEGYHQQPRAQVTG